MGLFGSLFSGGRRSQREYERAREEAVRAFAAHEPAPRLVGEPPAPWAGALASALDSADAGGLLALLAPLDDAGRFHLLDDVADAIEATGPEAGTLGDALLATLAGASDPLHRTLAGVVHRGLGWAARGREAEDRVLEEDAETFRTHLRTGFDLLTDAGRGLGGDGLVPFLHAQACAYALPATQRAAAARLWQELDPFHRDGLAILGDQFGEQWSREPRAQLDLAESLAHRAPAGSAALGLVPALVLARWNYLSDVEGVYDEACDDQTVSDERV